MVYPRGSSAEPRSSSRAICTSATMSTRSGKSRVQNGVKINFHRLEGKIFRYHRTMILLAITEMSDPREKTSTSEKLLNISCKALGVYRK